MICPPARPGVARPARGFTLVELLVVVAIVALLASILAPGLRRVQELTRRGVCSANLKNLGNALNSYAAENGRKLPMAGAWYNNAMMLYVMYEFNPSYGEAAGFNNLGLLAKADFIPRQSDLPFCPSVPPTSWLSNAKGNQGHGNCLPWAGGGGFNPQAMLPGDREKYGWVNKRSSFIRRTLGETSRTQCKGMDLLGSQAFLADVFNSESHAGERHVQGVNVWYGSGNVRWNDVQDPADWPDGSYVSGHQTLRYMWEYFDDNSEGLSN